MAKPMMNSMENINSNAPVDYWCDLCQTLFTNKNEPVQFEGLLICEECYKAMDKPVDLGHPNNVYSL